MAVILCFTRLQTIILCSSPLRRQTATASAEMISNRFSKMSVARLLPYIISLKWREKKREQTHKSITTAHFTRWKDESFECVCVSVLKTCREGQLWRVHSPILAVFHSSWRMDSNLYFCQLAGITVEWCWRSDHQVSIISLNQSQGKVSAVTLVLQDLENWFIFLGWIALM